MYYFGPLSFTSVSSVNTCSTYFNSRTCIYLEDDPWEHKGSNGAERQERRKIIKKCNKQVTDFGKSVSISLESLRIVYNCTSKVQLSWGIYPTLGSIFDGDFSMEYTFSTLLSCSVYKIRKLSKESPQVEKQSYYQLGEKMSVCLITSGES